MTDDMQLYRVSVVITAEAAGVDEADARNVAENAVKRALSTVGTRLPDGPGFRLPLPSGHTVVVYRVIDLASAALNGLIKVGIQPNNWLAYPHKETKTD